LREPPIRPPGHRSAWSGRAVTLLFNGALAAAVMLALLIAIEAGFRLFPGLLPAMSFGSGRYDPELGMNVHGSRVVYNKVRYVAREPNRRGFMDVDHALAKPAGVVRVGFFGDSYVEALQVPLDAVFFRRLAERLGPRVETFGFGISGWGTLHALQAYRVFGAQYDLDLAVYVFVENDLGDNAFEIAGHGGAAGSAMPYAELADAPEGYRVRWRVEPGQEPWWHSAAKFVQRHSMLAHLVKSRLDLLRSGGVQIRATRQAGEMSGVAGTVPNQNDLPATWPPEYAERARSLGEHLLADFRDEAAARGAELLVLYVPRGEDQLTGALRRDDTWLPWLEATCARLGIPLLDPSDALRARLAAGERMYDDHWTPAGHEVVAETLAREIEPRLETGASPARY
jgi:hypothetical protein